MAWRGALIPFIVIRVMSLVGRGGIIKETENEDR
jgi:hypothetical protein